MTALPRPRVTDFASLDSAADEDGYVELLRVPAMSMGLFIASPGYLDVQDPHAEDEVYVIASGTAVLEIAGERNPVGPGSIAFVPAQLPHRFIEISTDLRVWVVFAPAET